MSNRIGVPQEVKSAAGKQELSSEIFWEAEKGDLILNRYAVKTSKGMKINVFLLSTVQPLRGVTKDDGKKKLAVFKLYDFTKGGTDLAGPEDGNINMKAKVPKVDNECSFVHVRPSLYQLLHNVGFKFES